MDCTDMVVASVHIVHTFDEVWVGDFYTKDRSTPMPDEIYKGRDHITAAYGFQKDGMTVVMFRKPITGETIFCFAWRTRIDEKQIVKSPHCRTRLAVFSPTVNGMHTNR